MHVFKMHLTSSPASVIVIVDRKGCAPHRTSGSMIARLHWAGNKARSIARPMCQPQDCMPMMCPEVNGMQRHLQCGYIMSWFSLQTSVCEHQELWKHSAGSELSTAHLTRCFGLREVPFPMRH